MTELEQRLQYALGDTKLYKYHDTEDYDDGIPDVYDDLSDKLDYDKAQLKELSVRFFRQPNGKDSYKLEVLRSCIQRVTDSLKAVQEDSTRYYFFDRGNTRKATAIEEEIRPLYTVQVINNEVIQTKTDKSVLCYIINDIKIVPEVSEMDGKPITNSRGFEGEEPYYLYSFYSSGAGDKLMLCQDCDCMWLFSSKDQAWYAQKRFDPPKRCPVCRRTRRIIRNTARIEEMCERASNIFSSNN